MKRIGTAPEPIRASLAERGFGFLGPEERSLRLATLSAAAYLIDLVPTLSAAANGNIAEIFLVDAQEAYDLSHSEPGWPNWIFISVPRGAGQVSALRAAENIVHEAMHLNLTRLEARLPLVADFETTIYSPWMERSRPVQGILHGLYVFTCIAAFFDALLGMQILDASGKSHVAGRLRSIENEIDAVAKAELASGLTTDGLATLAQLERMPSNA